MSTIWSCKVGRLDDIPLPRGADLPMRQAIQEAYHRLTGRNCEFTFSGWGDDLTENELAVVEAREPRS